MISSRHGQYAAVLIGLLVLFAWFFWHAPSSPSAHDAMEHCTLANRQLQRLLPKIDLKHPGYGFDHYAKATVHNAEAYAIMASVFTQLGMREAAQNSAEWLVQNGIKPGGFGWGIPFAWDAFGDGTINPQETIYGVSVALAARALLDVCEAFGHTDYCNAAFAALDHYMRFWTGESDGGYFWYSNQKHDAIDVHNVNALLAAQYARAGKISGRPDFMQIADQAARHIWRSRVENELGIWWPYSSQNTIPNDLVHAVMMIEGMREYSKYGGGDFPIDRMHQYLNLFLSEQKIPEFARHQELPKDLLKRPARVWGVSALITETASINSPQIIARTLSLLGRYQEPSGNYRLTPEKSETAPLFDAYAARALATVLNTPNCSSGKP